MHDEPTVALVVVNDEFQTAVVNFTVTVEHLIAVVADEAEVGNAFLITVFPIVEHIVAEGACLDFLLLGDYRAVGSLVVGRCLKIVDQLLTCLISSGQIMFGRPLPAVLKEGGQIIVRYALAGLAQPLVIDAIQTDRIGTRTDMNLKHLSLHFLVFVP